MIPNQLLFDSGYIGRRGDNRYISLMLDKSSYASERPLHSDVGQRALAGVKRSTVSRPRDQMRAARASVRVRVNCG
jgi:hypothetical protein